MKDLIETISKPVDPFGQHRNLGIGDRPGAALVIRQQLIGWEGVHQVTASTQKARRTQHQLQRLREQWPLMSRVLPVERGTDPKAVWIRGFRNQQTSRSQHPPNFRQHRHLFRRDQMFE